MRGKNINFLRKLLAAVFIFGVKVGFAQGADSPALMPRELVELANSIGCSPYYDHYRDPVIHDPPFVYDVLPDDSLPPYSSAAFWCHKVEDGRDSMVLVLATFKMGYPPKGENDYCFDGKFCYGIRVGKILGTVEIEGRGACGLGLWAEPVPYNWLRRVDTKELVNRPGELTKYSPIAGVAGDGICPSYYFEDGVWYTFRVD